MIKANMPKQIQTDESERLTLSATSVKLDAQGNAPTRIPLFTTFDHPNSIKGKFSVDMDDLKQMKENFDAGIGFPTEDASTGLPIDFEHKWLEKAAAWIKGLELVADPDDDTKGTLFANPVEWTPDGEQAVKDGRYKMISPMGAFGKKSGKLSLWSNVTNLKEKVANVIEGAGLTNAPFQRGMQPIRADKARHLTQDSDTVIYVYDSKQKPKELAKMSIDELRIKERDDLSVPELDFIIENKAELSKEELTKFKLEEEPEKDEKEKGEELTEEEKQNLAAIKDGSKKLVDSKVESVEKDRLTRMESTIDKYRNEDVKNTLDKHVKRGAIKQDQAKLDGFWAKQLLGASTEDEEKVVKDALDALPDNEELSKEHGSAEDANAGSTAREQLDALAQEKVAAAAKDGKELLYTDALKQVYREKEDLRTQDSQEQKQKVGA